MTHDTHNQTNRLMTPYTQKIANPHLKENISRQIPNSPYLESNFADETVGSDFGPVALRQAMKLQRKTKFPRHITGSVADRGMCTENSKSIRVSSVSLCRLKNPNRQMDPAIAAL